MTIVIEDLQMEALAQQLANAKGTSIGEVLQESLVFLAGSRGIAHEIAGAHQAETPSRKKSPSDGLSDDQILGYN